MNICLYTAIFNGYETLKVPVHIEGLDYVCFSDDKSIHSDVWDVRHVSIPEGVPAPVFGKSIKCLPHKILSEYDYTIWLDANFQLRDQQYLSFLFDQFHSDKLLLYKHFCLAGDYRSCIYREIEHSHQCAKYRQENLTKQSMEYRKQGYPKNNGLYQSGFLLRNNRDQEVFDFNESWLSEIEKFGHVFPQCQVSLPYTLWRQGMNFDVVSGKIWDTSRYYITNHGDSNKFLPAYKDAV